MDKIIKLQSIQGSGFDATKKLCDFDIPSGAVYDLSSSYINLVANVATDDGGANGGQGIYEITTRFDGKANVTPSVGFIKNASLRSAAAGEICNVRKVDTLQTSLYTHKKSFEMKEGDEYKNSENTISKSRVRHSPFTELNLDGTTKSKYVDHHIQIPLKELFNYCDYPEFDCNRHGAGRLALELQTDLFTATVSSTNADMAFQDRNKLADFTAAAGKSTFKTQYVFRSLGDSPFYVGQKVVVNFVNQAGAPNTGDGFQTKVITGISYIQDATGDQYKLDITFDSAITTSVGGSANVPKDGDVYDVTLGYAQFIAGGGTITNTFSSASLVLSVVGSPQGLDSKPRPYQTYSTEEYNGSGANITNHQHAVSIEPNCSGVYIAYPNAVLSSNAQITNASTIRLRHNDIDLTNRPVPYDSPLAYERLMMTMGNSGYKINAINPNVASTSDNQSSQAAYEGGAVLKTVLAASPLSPMNEYSQLQINHEGIQAGGAGLARVAVYKELQKVV